MASPIFISNKPSSLTSAYVLLGSKYFLYSLLRIGNGIKTLSPTHMRRWIPILVLSAITFKILFTLQRWVQQLECRGCEYLECVLNPHLIAICIIQFCVSSFEVTFWQALNSLDEKYQLSEYSEIIRLRGVGRQRTRTLQLQFRIVVSQFCLAIAVAWLPSLAVHAIVATLVFTQLSEKVGTDLSFFTCSLMLLFPPVQQIKFLLHFYSFNLLLRASLAPYFNKTMFQKSERKTWIRSRSGVLYGYMVPFYLLVISTSYVSALVFYFSHLSGLPELVRDLTDPFPDNYLPGTLQMSIWNSKQSVWANNKLHPEDSMDRSNSPQPTSTGHPNFYNGSHKTRFSRAYVPA